MDRRIQIYLACSKIFTSSEVMIGKLEAKIASKSERSWHHGRMRGSNEIQSRHERRERGLLRCRHSVLPSRLTSAREVEGSGRFADFYLQNVCILVFEFLHSGFSVERFFYLVI